MAAPDRVSAGRSDLLGFVDRVGFQRWAAILLVAEVVGIAMVLARIQAQVAAPLAILEIVIIPPVFAALVWSLRDRLGVPSPWQRAITGLGLLGAALELVDAIMATSGPTTDSSLNLIVLVCQAAWMLAFGLGSRLAHTMPSQTGVLAMIAGIGLLIAGIGRLLPRGATADAVEAFASVLVIAQYVLLFQLARTRPTPGRDLV